MTGKSIATTPSRLTIEPTGSLRERFAAHIFPLKPARGAQLISVFDKLLPPEGSRARELCERRISNASLAEMVSVTSNAFQDQFEYTGGRESLPDPLVEALSLRAINFNPKKSGLRVSDEARSLATDIDLGWQASRGQAGLDANPLAKLGFFAEGLEVLGHIAPKVRFPDIYEDGLDLESVYQDIMLPLAICGRSDTDLERRVYIRSQELTYRVNHSLDERDWYLDAAARFFAPGYEAQGDFFADMGFPDLIKKYVDIAYGFYQSISEDPPYETFVDFARVSLNPLNELAHALPQVTPFMVTSALFQYAIQDPRFYAYCNGKLPDDHMMIFKSLNPSDKTFEIPITDSASHQFNSAMMAVHTNSLAMMTRLVTPARWNVAVSYADCASFKDQIQAAPFDWQGELDPRLRYNYQQALREAILGYNHVIRKTNPEDQLEMPLIAANEDFGPVPEKKDDAPSVH